MPIIIAEYIKINGIKKDMNKKIIWFTGLNLEYYNTVYSQVIDSWSLLPGDIKIYSDDMIDVLSNDSRFCISNIDYNISKKLNHMEFKFFKKSRSIIKGVKESIGKYDFCIWLDADVKVIRTPDLLNLLPTDLEIISANSKIPDNNTAIDTGFLAINLNHPNINDWIFQYENFWETIEFDSLTFRYDTLVLEEIIKKNNYPWKNLWYGFIKYSRKHYCGFEDSELENYFLHYWGKFKREIIQPSST